MNELALFEATIAVADQMERAALLDRECAGMPELRAWLDQLLAAHGRTNPVLDQPLAPGIPIDDPGEAATADAQSRVEIAGTIVAGRYKLLQQIGEGGMGTPWMADQTEPVKRRVAVKLIRVERVHDGTARRAVHGAQPIGGAEAVASRAGEVSQDRLEGRAEVTLPVIESR